jgi:hypothetical protein
MLTPMHASTVHVEPNRVGRWVVRYGTDHEPRSEHNSATEAECAARDGAAGQSGLLLLVRDRYSRVHVAGTIGG